jgi:hypothetical protein
VVVVEAIFSRSFAVYVSWALLHNSIGKRQQTQRG